jgi:hypothetical protein
METRSSPPSPGRARAAARRIVALVAAVVVATVLVGCDESETSGTPPPQATAGLVVLAGDPGDASLTIHDAGGASHAVPLPDPSTAWISAGGRGTLMATLDDGSLHVSSPIAPGEPPTWTPTPGEDVELPPDRLYFATWAPNAVSVAAIGADFSAGRLTLAVVDPFADASLLLPVPRDPAVAPPAWIDEQRVLVQATDGFVVVDTGTGDVTAGPRQDLGGGIGVAIAPAASLLAVAPEAGLVEVHDLGGWLGGQTGDPQARIENQGEIGALAFDRSGERLAVVWQRPDGPGLLTVHRRADGWSVAHEQTLPGESARAVVDFLP